MVEVEGDRAPVASCIRRVSDGMKVRTQIARAHASRKLVVELLIADQPDRERVHDRSSHLWKTADSLIIKSSRFPQLEAKRRPKLDGSHAAMQVNLDACIHCGLCVWACRDGLMSLK